MSSGVKTDNWSCIYVLNKSNRTEMGSSDNKFGSR